ncbi:SDR family NAD(P)-dependent oxidoreductase [Novosphingobium aquimarinum]|uniref:SDR family NAD(P)-dependent oxidoreductase n=1 Tax=Novosphingobium aquimarinum TaxID=2682494 RepID=UPI0012EC0E88|nr:SDR family oxidoreductase [Novosphingobium aquimarinum]
MSESAQPHWAGSRRLAGKGAVVAGASTGIGRATALRLAGEGARVLVGSPAGERALIDSLVDEIRDSGGEAYGADFDATDEASIAALIEQGAAHLGSIDAVHANFADLQIIFEDSDAVSVSDEVIERTLDVNLKGMIRITRHAVPRLLEGGGGAMIYTSSTASIVGEATRPCYAIAKSGINALVRHTASRWGREGLRANAVLPGLVITPEKRNSMPTDFQAEVLELGRSPRLGEPEDIAAMVALLASQDGYWINGQCIAVDGGNTLSRG